MKAALLMTQRKCFSGPSNRQKAVSWLEAAGAFFRLFLRNRKFCFPQAAKRLLLRKAQASLSFPLFPGKCLDSQIVTD